MTRTECIAFLESKFSNYGFSLHQNKSGSHMTDIAIIWQMRKICVVKYVVESRYVFRFLSHYSLFLPISLCSMHTHRHTGSRLKTEFKIIYSTKHKYVFSIQLSLSPSLSQSFGLNQICWVTWRALSSFLLAKRINCMASGGKKIQKYLPNTYLWQCPVAQMLNSLAHSVEMFILRCAVVIVVAHNHE